MKKVRVFSLLMTVVLLLSLLSGCSAPNSKDEYNGDANVSATGSGIYENGAETESGAVAQDRKLIRTITMRAETADQDALLTDLDAKLASLGGYVQNKSVNNSQSSNRSASLVLRIPAENLDAFVDHVEGETNILSVNESAEDITMTYIDVQSHITALETEEARLLELVAQAENLNELLLLETKLTEVRTKLEKYRSQLNAYDNLVDYATVNLTITEVKEYTVVEEEEPTAWQRIGTGFVNSLKGAWNIVREVFIFVIIALPYLLLVALIPTIVLVSIWLSKKIKNKRRGSKTQK